MIRPKMFISSYSGTSECLFLNQVQPGHSVPTASTPLASSGVTLLGVNEEEVDLLCVQDMHRELRPEDIILLCGNEVLLAVQN